MKKTIIFILLLCSTALFSQQSQSEFAATYSDGTYNWHRNMSGKSNPESYQDDGPKNLKFIKDDAEEVVEIQFQGEDQKWVSYFPDAAGVSVFVRYYRSTTIGSDRCFYFDKKGLWVVEISSYDESVDRINAFLGKKPASGRGLKESLAKYLEATKKFQETDRAAVTIKNHEIKSIVPQFVWLKEPSANGYFYIGITTIRDDGVVLKNKPLGGNQNEKDYEIYLTQYKDGSRDELLIHKQLAPCERLDNGKIKVEIKRKDTGAEVYNGMLEVPCFYSESHLKYQAEKENGKVDRRLYEDINVWKKGNKYGLVDKTEKVLLESVYDSIGQVSVWDYVVIRKDGKYGYVHKKGKIALPAEYDKVDFTPGYFKVCLNNKWGFVTESGVKVVAPKYDEAGVMQSKRSNVRLGDKWGVIDETGKEIVKPEYEKIWKFDPNIAVAAAKKDGKFGFINAEGKVVVPIIYDGVHLSFDSGKAAVRKGDAWGFVDVNGTVVLPFIFKYDYISEFTEGLAIVQVNNSKDERFPGKRYGMVDQKGNIVVSLVYDYIADMAIDGYYRCAIKKGGSLYYGLIDSKGDLVVYPVYKDIANFVNGYAVVKYDRFYGYINSEFVHVTPMIYNAAENVRASGHANVWIDSQFFSLKKEENGFLRMEPSAFATGIDFGGFVYVLNDTKKVVNVISRNNSSLCDQGEIMPVRHEHDTIYVTEGVGGEKIELKVLNDKNQSGNVYRVSPYIR